MKILHDAFKRIVETPEWTEYAKRVEVTDAHLNTEDFNRLAIKETEEARAYLKQIGVVK